MHPRGSARRVTHTAIPAEATTCTEVAELAREHLPLVVLPEAACHDLDQLDTAVEGRAWAQAAWKGMRALQAYAEEAAEFNGGFYEWCKHTTNPWSWPATSKKLAMRESETVMNNDRLRSHRLLPVSETVDPSGRILMEAHLKIAEGGGNLASRIYFHDDTKGTTHKVHVGFFGPHHLMPNTKT